MKVVDVVFTNHAIERLKERGITGEKAWQTIMAPDNQSPGKEKHTTEFVKKIEDKTITCIGKKNDIGEWVVLSAWMDPPLEGTNDFRKRQDYKKERKNTSEYYRKLSKASFWGKLWLTFKKQAGF